MNIAAEILYTCKSHANNYVVLPDPIHKSKVGESVLERQLSELGRIGAEKIYLVNSYPAAKSLTKNVEYLESPRFDVDCDLLILLPGLWAGSLPKLCVNSLIGLRDWVSKKRELVIMSELTEQADLIATSIAYDEFKKYRNAFPKWSGVAYVEKPTLKIMADIQNKFPAMLTFEIINRAIQDRGAVFKTVVQQTSNGLASDS